MYPEAIVQPCREELTSIGVQELRTPEEVEGAMSAGGTTFIVVNSVCGCAAGGARPAVRLALQNQTLPDKIITVFAGVDGAAVDKARSYMIGYPPSSPSMALFKDGELVHMIERHMIEGNHPEQIAENIKRAFDTFCK